MSASLLFVCTANRVRSPFAAAVARRLVAEHDLPLDVDSAGFLDAGYAADADMSHVARKRGLDLSGHVSRQVDVALLERSDIVIAMTGQHVIDLAGIAPTATRRILTLREAAAASQENPPDRDAASLRNWVAGAADRPLRALLDGSRDTADPMGRSMRRYRAAADEIEELVDELLTTRPR